MSEITTIIVAVLGSGAISAVVNLVCRLIEKSIERKSGANESMRLLLKDRLRFLCVHYIQQGWIYEDELEDLMRMHECYHEKLHGNGYLDTLINKVKGLEIRGIGI